MPGVLLIQRQEITLMLPLLALPLAEIAVGAAVTAIAAAIASEKIDVTIKFKD